MNTSLPIGALPWKINANGFEGDLILSAVDAEGRLTGTVLGNNIVGFWDEASQRITFIRVSNPTDHKFDQVYTGYLFRNPLGPDSVFTLAGSFQTFQGTWGSAQRNVFGWFAQMNVPG
jgi:hypothetical protein